MKLADRIQLRRPDGLSTTVRPPGSKSLTNRALLLAAMAQGRSTVRGCLDSDDARLMRTCLDHLGVRQSEAGVDRPGDLRLDAALGRGPEDWTIDGHGTELGRRQSARESLYVGTAGTVARFLTAALAAAGAEGEVDGSARMRERPMGTLLDHLVAQGAAIEGLGQPGFLPVRLAARSRGYRGGEVVIEEVASSQFVSALAIAACFADTPTHLVLRRGTPARPYVDMTLRTIESFGGHAQWTDESTIVVEPRPLVGSDYIVEPDASAASYFLGLACIHGGRVEIEDLGRDSLQGDAQFYRYLEQMGAQGRQDADSTHIQSGERLIGAQLDMTDVPDMTLTAAVVALFAEGPTEIRGVEILRHHECDRLAAGATELRKLGAEVQEFEDGLHIVPPVGGPRAGVEIATYDDHRMAMAFAMVGDVAILDPACSSKTYPRYFEELDRLGMVVDGLGS